FPYTTSSDLKQTRKSPDASRTVQVRPVAAAVPVQELFADADQLRMAVARPPAQYSAGTRLAGTGRAECAVADGAGRGPVYPHAHRQGGQYLQPHRGHADADGRGADAQGADCAGEARRLAGSAELYRGDQYRRRRPSAIAAVHPRAQADPCGADAGRAWRSQDAGGISYLAELDRRQQPEQRRVRATAPERSAGPDGRPGKVLAQRASASAGPDPHRPEPLPVRDHPPLSRWQRPYRPPADHPVSGGQGPAAQAGAVPVGLLRAQPWRLLRRADRSAQLQ